MNEPYFLGKGKTKQGTTKYKQIQNKEELRFHQAQVLKPQVLETGQFNATGLLRGGGLAQVKPRHWNPGSVLHYHVHYARG